MSKKRQANVIPPSRQEDAPDHQLHVYYGFGKGKTTACMGLALRALGAAKRVAIVQFDKGYDGEVEHYSERHILRTLEGITLFPTGCERMMPNGDFRFGAEPQDLAEAQRGLQLSRDAVTSGTADVVILDEILAAAAFDLLEQNEVEALLDVYDADRKCELVLSGHKVWDGLVERADLVTEMRKVKHYYAKGTPARLGIEY
jgi:cob(I)alamin adenosyltransferase